MAVEVIDTALIGSIIRDIGLAVAFAIFIYLSLRHNLADVSRFSTFRFWLSLAVILWLIGEAFFSGLATTTGRIIHIITMVMFPSIVIAKAYGVFMKRR